jgi:hypothetical protein
VLRSQTKINQARKAIIKKIVKERMSVQEFETIKDGLDRLLVQLMIKKNALVNASFRIPSNSLHQQTAGSAHHLKKEKEKSGRNHLKIKLNPSSSTTPSATSTTNATTNQSDNLGTLHPSDHPNNNNQLTVLENKIKKCDHSIALTLHKRRMFIMKVAPLLVHQSSSSNHHHHLGGKDREGKDGEVVDVGRMVSRIHAIPESSVYAELDQLLHENHSKLLRNPNPDPNPNPNPNPNSNPDRNSNPILHSTSNSHSNPNPPNQNQEPNLLNTLIPQSHPNHSSYGNLNLGHGLHFGGDGGAADKLIIDHLDPSGTRFLI